MTTVQVGSTGWIQETGSGTGPVTTGITSGGTDVMVGHHDCFPADNTVFSGRV